MSADATGHVYRFSPYKGAIFDAHHAIGDSVNDMNDNLFWMSQSKLAKKARISERAAREALARLEKEGWIERVEEQRGEAGRGTTYQFVFKEGPIVWDSRTPAKSARVNGTGPRQSAPRTPAPRSADPGKSPQSDLLPTQRNPKEPNPPASPEARPTDDPITKHAHSLTVLAMEQPKKPVLRGSGNPFPAVMAIFDRLLRAGESVQAIDRAIKAGIEVWTVHGIQTAIAQTKPRREREQLGGNIVDLGIAVAKGDA